jgi:hypothetical protein
MDHHDSRLGEFEPDDLQKISSAVRADGQKLWRVGFNVKVDDDDRVIDCVPYVVGADVVPERRPVNLHTSLA